MALSDKSKPKKLTAKQAAFVKSKIDNPTQSLAKHVIEAGYDAKDMISASNMGHELMNKPQVIMALGEYSDKAESVLVGVMDDWGRANKPRQREIAVNAAMFVHDKVHGKATTRIETQSSIVRININLTGDGDESPPAELLDDVE